MIGLRRILAAARVRLGDNAGATLPELLVTILIASIAMGAVVTTVVTLSRTVGVANATMTDLDETRNAMMRVGQLLRGGVASGGLFIVADAQLAPAFTTATPSEAVFYSTTGQPEGAPPIRVRLSVSTEDELLEEIWQPDSSGAAVTWPDPARERVLARGLTSDAVFAYWSHYQAASDPDSNRCGLLLASGGTVTGTTRSLIDSVAYEISLRAPGGYANTPVELEGFTRLASAYDLGYSDSLDSAGCL